MGFTRSTTDISVHQKLEDYPNRDNGLTPEEIKKRYDMPAETLQKDLNKLEEELENTAGAGQIGAQPFDENDASENNIQAKLNRLRKDIQEASLGQIPDGTITESKLSTDLTGILAKKNGELQTNLNAEKIGGYNLESLIQLTTEIGTFTWNKNEETVVNCGFKPKAIIIQFDAIDSNVNGGGIIVLINGVGTIINTYNSFNSTSTGSGPINASFNETGFVLPSVFSVVGYDRADYSPNCNYIAFR